jgi:hypothetical protein
VKFTSFIVDVFDNSYEIYSYEAQLCGLRNKQVGVVLKRATGISPLEAINCLKQLIKYKDF